MPFLSRLCSSSNTLCCLSLQTYFLPFYQWKLKSSPPYSFHTWSSYRSLKYPFYLAKNFAPSVGFLPTIIKSKYLNSSVYSTLNLSFWSYKYIPAYSHSLTCIQVLTGHLPKSYQTIFSKAAVLTCDEFFLRSSAQICCVKLFWKGQSEQNESKLLWAQEQYELMLSVDFNGSVKT